jgi:hypothetical protein
MRKIATPQDLQAELRRLLAYSQERQPSRQVLASELMGLAASVNKLSAGKNVQDAQRAVGALGKTLDTVIDIHENVAKGSPDEKLAKEAMEGIDTAITALKKFIKS